MGEVQPNLLVSAANGIDLPLGTPRLAQRYVRLALLLEQVARKEAIFASQLEIDSASGLVVIKGLRQEPGQLPHLDRSGRTVRSCDTLVRNAAEDRIPYL